MQKKRFGIDIDGTVTHPASLVPHINKAFQLNISLEDITEYEITDCINIPPKDFYQWFIKAEPTIYKESPPADGVKSILSAWSMKHELIFISARNRTLLDVTKNWFSTHQIDYDHIELIGTHDKVGTAKKFNVDLFFEDKHDNAVAISEELNIPVLLFDTPYNRKPSPKNVIRVHSWEEANQWVAKWLILEQQKKKEA